MRGSPCPWPEARSRTWRILPHGIYTIPEVGTVGETEESLQRQGVDYVVGRAHYRDTARGRIIGDTNGFSKLLCRRQDLKVLGVHIVGEEATEIVHIGMMVMLVNGTAEMLDEICFNLPTLGELYKYAAFDVMLRSGRLEVPPPPFVRLSAPTT